MKSNPTESTISGVAYSLGLIPYRRPFPKPAVLLAGAGETRQIFPERIKELPQEP